MPRLPSSIIVNSGKLLRLKDDLTISIEMTVGRSVGVGSLPFHLSSPPPSSFSLPSFPWSLPVSFGLSFLLWTLSGPSPSELYHSFPAFAELILVFHILNSFLFTHYYFYFYLFYMIFMYIFMYLSINENILFVPFFLFDIGTYIINKYKFT